MLASYRTRGRHRRPQPTGDSARHRSSARSLAVVAAAAALLTIGVSAVAPESVDRPQFFPPAAALAAPPTSPEVQVPATAAFPAARRMSTGYRMSRVQLVGLFVAGVTAAAVTGGALGVANRPLPAPVTIVSGPAPVASPETTPPPSSPPRPPPLVQAVAVMAPIVAPAETTTTTTTRPAPDTTATPTHVVTTTAPATSADPAASVTTTSPPRTTTTDPTTTVVASVQTTTVAMSVQPSSVDSGVTGATGAGRTVTGATGAASAPA